MLARDAAPFLERFNETQLSKGTRSAMSVFDHWLDLSWWHPSRLRRPVLKSTIFLPTSFSSLVFQRQSALVKRSGSDEDCCKGQKGVKEVTDDAGRKCCENEMQNVELRVRKRGNLGWSDVGHGFVHTPNKTQTVG